MSQLKEKLAETAAHFNELEARARQLQNQNFADVVKSVSGKITQIMSHPDFDRVAELHGEAPASANLGAFRAELTALENSGDGQTDRAKALRAHIEQLTDVRRKASLPEAPFHTEPFPGNAEADHNAQAMVGAESRQVS